MKTSIVVLTRGYDEISKYSFLIKRNKSISKYLHDKTIPVLIFHEGNITEMHQQTIISETPELNLHFIDIKKDGKSFCNEKELLEQKSGYFFDIGYRHMCHFWFVDFWKFVEEYDAIIRVDEDCIIEFSLDSFIEKMEKSSNNIVLWSGKIMNDDDFVCVNLNQFTREFIGENTQNKYPSSGPYTNFLSIRVDRLRKNKKFIDYVDLVDKSNNIYHYRWGDLPLWGEAVTYILGNESLNIDTEIVYYHGSHDKYVNKN